MAYQSLYRRYRSRRFEEVLGQEHVTTALKNSVREGRVAHGYLFSGPRGTGKTSTARILAKVLNCSHPVDGEPDTTCDNCKAVEEGRPVDWLQELDAASNSGVDAIRDLLGRVSMGTSGNRKVYILDEVHMLTKAASNALLKTLEEPPEHVVFVLATTEPEKVLPTIRSRTQHFDFHLLPADVLADHVRHVIDDAGLGLGEDAVEHVVKAGAGSARDTLSALDQVAATGGVSSHGVPVEEIVDALGATDAGAALLAVDASVRDGRDPRLLAEALIQALREAFLVSMGAPAGSMTDAAAARAGEVAAALGPASLTRSLELIGTAMVDMRQAPDPRITLEVALVRLCRPGGDDIESLVARIERLEQRLAELGAVPAAAPGPAVGADTADPPERNVAATAPVTAAPTGTAAGARGADAARARLNQREAVSTDPPVPTGSPPAGSRPTLGSMRRGRGGGEAADSSDAAPPPPVSDQPVSDQPVSDQPVPDQPEPDQPGPGRPEPSVASTAGGGAPPSIEELTAAWTDQVLPSLRPRARALFKPGHFVVSEGSSVCFALPNQAHRDQCEGNREEVAEAIGAHFGTRIQLELTVADGSSPSSSPSSPATGSSAGPGTTEEVDEVDLEELADAPDAETGGIAQLQDAFPGAELMEDS